MKAGTKGIEDRDCTCWYCWLDARPEIAGISLRWGIYVNRYNWNLMVNEGILSIVGNFVNKGIAGQTIDGKLLSTQVLTKG